MYRAQVFCYAKSCQYLLRFTNSFRQNVVNLGRKQVSRQLIGKVSPRVVFGLGIPFIPSVHAFWGKMADSELPIEMSSHEKLVADADTLYTENSIVELYTLLKSHREDPVAEVQWRVARAAYEMSKLTEKAAEKKVFLYEAFECVKKSLELDANNSAANKWYAIMLDSIGELEGTKQRITNAFLVKEHFMKAIELNTTDATSVHLLGQWCFMFADMSWYTRKIAAVIFASPPTSTYEEALQYFEKAESIEPNFYSKNLLMLGKTCLRMGNKPKAKEYLTRAHEYPVKTEDDKASHKEAQELLKSV